MEWLLLTALQVAGKQHNLLVAASTSQMMVYNSERLVWAAKGATCPVAVKVASFAGQQGDLSQLKESAPILKSKHCLLLELMLIRLQLCPKGKKTAGTYDGLQ